MLLRYAFRWFTFLHAFSRNLILNSIYCNCYNRLWARTGNTLFWDCSLRSSLTSICNSAYSYSVCKLYARFYKWKGIAIKYNIYRSIYKVTLMKLALLKGPNIFFIRAMWSSIKPRFALSSITSVAISASSFTWMTDPRSNHDIEYSAAPLPILEAYTSKYSTEPRHYGTLVSPLDSYIIVHNNYLYTGGCITEDKAIDCMLVELIWFVATFVAVHWVDSYGKQ